MTTAESNARGLVQAATNARYLFQVYCQFGKPVPAPMLEKCCRDLQEALEEYHLANPAAPTNLPTREKLRELETLQENGLYMDTVEWSSQ